MEAKLLMYTADGCAACRSMKSVLERLGVGFTEIRITNGMAVSPDVRSFPTLAREKDGKRTTICMGWPGNDGALERILNSFGVPLKGEKQ
jgi:hypothetical protein